MNRWIIHLCICLFPLHVHQIMKVNDIKKNEWLAVCRMYAVCKHVRTHAYTRTENIQCMAPTPGWLGPLYQRVEALVWDALNNGRLHVQLNERSFWFVLCTCCGFHKIGRLQERKEDGVIYFIIYILTYFFYACSFSVTADFDGEE